VQPRARMTSGGSVREQGPTLFRRRQLPGSQTWNRLLQTPSHPQILCRRLVFDHAKKRTTLEKTRPFMRIRYSGSHCQDSADTAGRTRSWPTAIPC
jgi:hypothetical protein